MTARLPRAAREAALARQDFLDRVETLAGEVVRYDAPRGWVVDLVEATGLVPESTDAEIVEAATSWAQDEGCYADPEGEES